MSRGECLVIDFITPSDLIIEKCQRYSGRDIRHKKSAQSRAFQTADKALAILPELCFIGAY